MSDKKMTYAIEVDDKGSTNLKKIQGEFNKVKDEAEKAGKSIDSIKSNFNALSASGLALAGAFFGVTKAFSSFIQEAAEAEKIENRLKFALENTGYQWGKTKFAVDEFASSIQETTRFADDEARQALTDMMLYTRDFGKAQMGAKLAMDMSVRTGHELRESTQLIGMAMSGNVERLGRYIPELRNLDDILGKDATMAQKAEYALKVLNEKFSGTAQDDVKTFAGQMAQLKNEWADFSELIGGFLIGPATGLLKWLKDAIKEFKELGTSMKVGLGMGSAEENLKAQISKLKDQASKYMAIYESQAPSLTDLNTGAISEFQLPILSAAERTKALEEAVRLEGEIQRLEGELKKLSGGGVISKADTFADEGKKRQKYIEDLTKHYEYLKKAEIDAFKAEKEYEALDLKKQEEVAKGIATSFNNIVVAEVDAFRAGKEYEALDFKKQKEQVDALTVSFLKQAAAMEEGRKEDKEYEFRELKKQLDAERKLQEEQSKMIEGFGNSIASGWASAMKEMIKGTKSFGDAFKSMVDSMLDTFLNAITDMIANFLIFGSITGGKGGASFGATSGGFGGVLGLIGGLLFKEGGMLPGGFLPVKAFAGGGIATSPTFGLIGEAGQDEAVIPLKNGKVPVESKGSSVTNVFIHAVDAASFEEVVRRNPGSILKVVKRNSENAGAMRGIMRSYI